MSSCNCIGPPGRCPCLMAVTYPLRVPQPSGWSESFVGVTVTDDEASGHNMYWPFDPDLIKQWEWLSLPEAERKRALTVQAAMNKARYNNPLAY